MSKTKKKTYENWSKPQLKACLMERIGDLYCFVWDSKQPNVEDLVTVMENISMTANKCVELLLEVESRDLESEAVHVLDHA